MKTILNFSHPLSDEAKAEIQSKIGDFQEVIVESRFDLDQPLRLQVDHLLYLSNEADRTPASPYSLTYIIPPTLSTAAFLLGAYFPLAPVIWVKGDSSTPPRFILGGIEYREQKRYVKIESRKETPR